MTEKQNIFAEMTTDTPDEPVLPILKDWQLLIASTDQPAEQAGQGQNQSQNPDQNQAQAIEYAAKAIQDFAKFWQSPVRQSFEPTTRCYLKGYVFGRAGFPDCSLIRTSSVVRIERIKQGYKQGAPHDLLCATTHSGSKYYFYSSTYNGEMFLLLGAALNN